MGIIAKLIEILNDDSKDELDKMSAALDACEDLEKLQAWIKYGGHHEDCGEYKWKRDWPATKNTPIPDCSCGLEELRESCKVEL